MRLLEPLGRSEESPGRLRLVGPHGARVELELVVSLGPADEEPVARRESLGVSGLRPRELAQRQLDLAHARLALGGHLADGLGGLLRRELREEPGHLEGLLAVGQGDEPRGSVARVGAERVLAVAELGSDERVGELEDVRVERVVGRRDRPERGVALGLGGEDELARGHVLRLLGLEGSREGLEPGGDFQGREAVEDRGALEGVVGRMRVLGVHGSS